MYQKAELSCENQYQVYKINKTLISKVINLDKEFTV